MDHLAPPSFLPLNHLSSTVVALEAVVCHIAYTFIQTAQWVTGVVQGIQLLLFYQYWALSETSHTLLMPRVMAILGVAPRPASPPAPAVHQWEKCSPHPSNSPKWWDSVLRSQMQPKVLIYLAVVLRQGWDGILDLELHSSLNWRLLLLLLKHNVKAKIYLLGLQTWESIFRLLKMYGCLRLHLNKHKNLYQGQRPDFMTITKNLRQQMNHIKHHFSQAESKCILWLLFISECLVKSKWTEGALRSHPVWGKMLQLRLQQKHQPFVFWGYGKDMGNKDPAVEKIQGRKMNHQLPGNTRSSLNGVKSCAGGAGGGGRRDRKKGRGDPLAIQ